MTGFSNTNRRRRRHVTQSQGSAAHLGTRADRLPEHRPNHRLDLLAPHRRQCRRSTDAYQCANAAAGTASTSGETDDNAGFFYLMEPLVLLGQTDIKSNLLLKNAAAANDCLRVELHGIRFIGG